MAEVLPHPGATGTAMPMVEPDPCDPPVKRDRDDAGHSLWAALVRGRMSPLGYLLAGLLLAGGGSAGTTMLLGPGGFRDDDLREEFAGLREDVSGLRGDMAAARSSLESCEAGIEALDDGQADLVTLLGDTAILHAKAITTIAIKLGIVEQIDVTPPRMGPRRVRR